MRFDHQIVCITGSSQHTGLALAEAYLEAGAIVWINGERPEPTRAAKELLAARFGDRVHDGTADITCSTEVDRLFREMESRHGRIDILVNNACHQGIGFNFLHSSFDEWSQVIDVNVNGMFRVSQQAARLMCRQGSGVIINLGSNAATHALRGRSPYCASKGAVDALTKAMAVELAEYQIRVNCVVPGYVRTSRWDGITENEAAKRRGNIPLGREILYKDIIHAVMFLSSPLAGNITGARLVVDGGSSAQLVPKALEVIIDPPSED